MYAIRSYYAGFPAPTPSGGIRKAGVAPAKPQVRSAQTVKGAPDVPQPQAVAKGRGPSELMRVRTLEEALKLLNDQGRLPPRGSPVDRSA